MQSACKVVGVLLRMFPFPTMSRLALNTTQPLIQTSPGILRPELDSPLARAMIKNVWTCTASLQTASCHGVELGLHFRKIRKVLLSHETMFWSVHEISERVVLYAPFFYVLLSCWRFNDFEGSTYLELSINKHRLSTSLYEYADSLCGLVVRVPGYITEMYCDSCEVRTEFICYVEESRPPLWSSGQSSWLHSGDVLWFLWGTNWIYIYVM
jgi:hypothetical protein